LARKLLIADLGNSYWGDYGGHVNIMTQTKATRIMNDTWND
jgi:hypothetical protein